MAAGGGNYILKDMCLLHMKDTSSIRDTSLLDGRNRADALFLWKEQYWTGRADDVMLDCVL